MAHVSGWLISAGVAVAVMAGCGAARPSTPESTAAAFGDALRDERFDDAYDLLSERYRRRVSLEEFRRHLVSHPEEARDAAEMLAQLERSADVTARIPYADGEFLELVEEDGSWHIRGNIAAFYDQSTPRNALRSFVRAMERRRYDVVMRFVPAADREGMTAERMREAWEGEARDEIERLIANLRANLDQPIEQVGDRATMPYGERFAVQFVRENGLWRIEDPD